MSEKNKDTMTILERVDSERSKLQDRADVVKAMLWREDMQEILGQDSDDKRDIGEMKANIMLAYRHLEDARMRLGKVIQAHDGGESIYDKK